MELPWELLGVRIQRSSRSFFYVPHLTLTFPHCSMPPLTSADAQGTHRLSSMKEIFLEKTPGKTCASILL